MTLDNDSRRLAYAVVGGTASHHNASFQEFPGEQGGSLLVWLTDLLPNTVAPAFTNMIEAGANVIKRTLAEV